MRTLWLRDSSSLTRINDWTERLEIRGPYRPSKLLKAKHQQDVRVHYYWGWFSTWNPPPPPPPGASVQHLYTATVRVWWQISIADAAALCRCRWWDNFLRVPATTSGNIECIECRINYKLGQRGRDAVQRCRLRRGMTVSSPGVCNWEQDPVLLLLLLLFWLWTMSLSSG